MVSIITAIHNQLPVNRLFYESIVKYTSSDWELIIIDNASDDGSAEFFESKGATVIRNNVNYSYPVSQNQGLSMAKGDWFAFLNNDIIVCPGWDTLAIQTMTANNLDVMTCCGVEQIENRAETNRIRRRWNFIKNIFYFVPKTYAVLKTMLFLMYGNWQKFTNKRAQKFKLQVKEGFVGNSVFLTKKAIELLGKWDERLQAADFDLYMRSKKRALDFNDIKPCHIALNIFHHHYIRFTVRNKPMPFHDQDNIIPFVEKWSETERNNLMKDIEL